MRADETRGAPLISIVLPVYNGATYLRQALDSVVAQTRTDFELICVDDCSTDATPDVLAQHAARDARIRVFRNAENLKLPGSLNRGFGEARGQWFSWTSDDNILRPNMLERLMHTARDNPGYDVFHADFTEIDEQGTAGKLIRVDPAEELVLGNAVGACFLYRREVDAAIGGYDEALFGVEDYDFWLRAARQFRFFQLHEDLYLYRRHGASLTSARAKSIHAMAAQIMQRELRAMPPSRLRARGYVNLVCRDFYTMRPHLLLRACADDPAVVVMAFPRIIRWLRYSILQRLRGATAG